MDLNLEWHEPGDDTEYERKIRADDLVETMASLENTNRAVHTNTVDSYELYSNRALSTFDWGTGIFITASLEPLSRTTDNVVVEICDSMLAEVGKARPKIKPVCHGASWNARRNAKKLDKFLWGEFVRNDIYEIAKGVLLDAEVCGFGCIKVVMDDNDRLKLEKVFPDEILVDQQEVATLGTLKTVYRRRALPLEVVAATWDVPEEKLTPISGIYNVNYRTLGSSYVIVGEAIKLPSKGCPGRRVVAVQGLILEDEEWDNDWFPYVFFHYNRPLVGFYAQSLVELIIPDQIRLNEINEVIEEAQRLFCGGRVFVQHGSKVSSAAIDNIVGKVIYYTGVKPEAVTWPAVSGELYNERDRLKMNAYSKVGLNQSASSGQLPAAARLDSSPAVRELNSVQDSRLADITQRYEKFFVQVATTMINVIRTSGVNPETTWFSGGKRTRSEKIVWSEMKLDDMSYTMTLEPASSFSMTPSAIRDDLESKLLNQQISLAEYQKQLSVYDPDSATNLLAASAENLDMTQEKLEDGIAVMPDTHQDLVAGVKQMTSAYNMLDFYDDVPVEVYEVFINWIEAANGLTTKGTEPAMEQEAAPPAQVAQPQMPGMVPGMGM